MLKSLLIQNYALIEKLMLQPDKGFNIITGETGAGKSIMLGALGLLLGNRADSKSLFDESVKCVVEAEFEVAGYSNLEEVFEENDLDFAESCLVRREVHPNGKSRAFVNDSPVTLDVLKQITPLLLDIHSQHETQFLANERYQLNLVDELGGLKTLLLDYQAIFQLLKVKENELKSLETSSQQRVQELDFIAFQLEELSDAGVKKGEKLSLEHELAEVEHAEEIHNRLFEARQLLSEGDMAGVSLLKQAQQSLMKISGFSSKFEEIRARLESAFIEVKDIVAELNHASDAAPGSNPARQQALEERLNLIYRLEKKHQCEADTLPEIQAGMESRMNLFESVDERIETLRAEVSQLQKQLKANAEVLTNARKEAAKPIAKEVAGLLVDLSMPFAQFDILFSEQRPDNQGFDAIEFLFSANKGSYPKPLRQVASGGEFSRLMLAIKYVIAGRTEMPTLIFDEIDTGVSGEVAAKMGRLMKGMAERHQIITITHTAQIAAMGHLHFYVEKAHSGSKTTSKVRQLNTEERIQEIAQMISGDRITTASLDTAKELLSTS